MPHENQYRSSDDMDIIVRRMMTASASEALFRWDVSENSMFSWLKRQIKKILPGLSDDILDLKPDGSLPEAGPSIIRDEKTEERDAKTVVDSPSHPIRVLKKALDDLVEKSDRISSTPGTAGQIPTEWFDLYDKAESAFREADLWVRGGEDGRYANAALKKHYKDSLWKAIAGLRTANRFREAVKLWSLARLSSDAFTEETVRLAEAVADHIKTDKDFSKTPETARNIALLGIEASVLIRFENGKQKKIECLFEGLRIDWATPKTHPQVVENIRTIKDLIDFGGLLSNPVIIDLGFWYAMGHWRTGLTSPAEPGEANEDRTTSAPDIQNEVIPDPETILSVFRIFLAYAAGRIPDAVSRLDYEVVEACLHGPNLKPQEHEPPLLRRTHVSTNTRSILPGPIAGVTRIATKKPEDPLSDVLPSELALLRMNPEAGLANILYGKPLIVEHETEKDKVPKHRTLVCFVADAGPDESVHVDYPGEAGRLHMYRNDYVYAKRQLFDLLRDLREGLELARRRSELEIDVAVFAVHPYRDEAAAFGKFPLDRISLPREGREERNRLVQLMDFAGIVPEFFEKASHTIRLKKQWFQDYETQVNVDKDDKTFIRADLSATVKPKLEDYGRTEPLCGVRLKSFVFFSNQLTII